MAVGTIWRVALKQAGSLVEERPYAWNVRHYITAADGSADTPETVADAFLDRMEAPIRSFIPQTARICRLQVALAITPATTLLDLPLDLPGTSIPLYSLPSFLCGLVRLAWSAEPANRRWDGKWLQGFIPIPLTGGQGLDNWNRLIALGDALALPATDPGSGTVYSPVVWRPSISDGVPVTGSHPSTRYFVIRQRGKDAGDITMDLRRDLA